MLLFFVLLTKVFVISFVCARKGYGPGEQDWGFIDIFDGAHMFYWLFYTTADVKNYTERPLLLWLQGGPGTSSSGHANFRYFGHLDLSGKEREYPWCKYVNLLLIDSPLGTGYSYVDDLKFLSRTNTDIANNLILTVKGFYKNHPEFLDIPVYIFSESFAGKMGAEFAFEMWKARKEDSTTIGEPISFHMGNPWIWPEMQNILIPSLQYTMGIIDEAQRDSLATKLNDINDLFNKGNYSIAWWELFKEQYPACERSAGVDYFNVYKPVPKSNAHSCYSFSKIDLQLYFDMNLKVKFALKIPLLKFWGFQRPALVVALENDIIKPAIHHLEKLLNETSLGVHVFSGSLDTVCPTTVTLAWIRKLNWPGKSAYQNATRKPFYVDDQLEGFEKNGGGLNMTWILRAGHLMVEDNPKTMAYILQKHTGILPNA